jgi:hypothetical protein
MKYILFLLIFVAYNSQAQESLEIQGIDSPLSDVTVIIDLSRVCSHPTSNEPNFYIEKDENIINLRISIFHSSIIPCDPPPPFVNSFMEINLGSLDSGAYELNILFVDSDESVITGTPFLMYPYHEPIYFQVAHIIPTLSLSSLIIMLVVLFMFGLGMLHKYTLK